MTTVQVRRVPENWEHPKNSEGTYEALFGPYNDAVAEWEVGLTRWKEGYYSKPIPGLPDPDHHGMVCDEKTYIEAEGERPKPENHMPAWTLEERTHWQMYELTSESTPISPVFSRPEELADWLAKNDDDHGMKHSKEDWLKIIRASAEAPGSPTSERTPVFKKPEL